MVEEHSALPWNGFSHCSAQRSSPSIPFRCKIHNPSPLSPLHTYLTLKCFGNHEDDDDGDVEAHKVFTMMNNLHRTCRKEKEYWMKKRYLNDSMLTSLARSSEMQYKKRSPPLCDADHMPPIDIPLSCVLPPFHLFIDKTSFFCFSMRLFHFLFLMNWFSLASTSQHRRISFLGQVQGLLVPRHWWLRSISCSHPPIMLLYSISAVHLSEENRTAVQGSIS